jgi:hypothetical protein
VKGGISFLVDILEISLSLGTKSRLSHISAVLIIMVIGVGFENIEVSCFGEIVHGIE